MDMASKFKIGQVLQGKLGTYRVSEKLHRDVWSAV